MAFPVRRTDYRRSGENIMIKYLTAFIAIVFLAGYAVQPPEKTVPYKVTVARGESVWDARSMSSGQKEKVIAAMDFFETLANHLETLTVAVEDMNYREEMYECGEDY